MKVLLIAMPFYGYEHRIKAEIERQGHQVDFMYDIEEWSFYKRTLFKISNIEKEDYDYKYQMSYLKKLRNDYDIVLVIVGRCLSPDFIDALKLKNPNAQFILYLWDEVKRVANFYKVSTKYNQIYSFDDEDCLKYNFNFLPLFYSDQCTLSNKEEEFDIYGSFGLHSDRLKIIENIVNKYPLLKTFFYIPVGKSFLFKKNVYNKNVSDFFHIKTLDFSKNIAYTQKSLSVLDIQHNDQRGLTIRTIETLGCGRKIITTNPNVKKYDFYNTDNILVIDRENIQIPKDFFKIPYKKIDEYIYRKYSIKQFIRTLITNETSVYQK